MKRLICLLLVCCTLIALLSCESDTTNATKLAFKDTLSYSDLKALDNTTVTINGYLATSSPVDGSFIFLMNMPLQNCPFCVPNTTTLSNTIEVYPKKNQSFDYTNQAVRVTGTLKVASSETDYFTDDYGYQFNFKITDAEYVILRSEDLAEEYAIFQKLSAKTYQGNDVLGEIDGYFNYLDFVCRWTEYYVPDEYYLWPEDVPQYLENSSSYYRFNQEGYIEGLIATISSVDETAFYDIIDFLRQAQDLRDDALKELDDEKYTCTYDYLEVIGKTDYKYTLTNGDTLVERLNSLYKAYANWLGSWEM